MDYEQSATFLEWTSCLSFSKFLLVSSVYCKNNIHVVFDLLSLDSFDPQIKGNLLIAIGDLYKWFTNTLEEHTGKFFMSLHSKNSYVWRHCFWVISHLALNDMIKIRGEISDIVRLLKDKDYKLVELVKLFLHEMHSKNNDSIFKLISHAINRISEIENFTEEDFKDIATILS